MSKIKDLLAIEENIDDLIPPRKPDYKYVAEQAVKLISSKGEDFRNYLWENMEVSEDYDDEGHKQLCFENFWDLCVRKARDAVEQIVEEQEMPLTDKEFGEAVSKTHTIIMSAYSDFESELLDEYKRATEESQAQRETYDNLTLPKQ